MDAWSKSSLKSLLEGCAWQWALQKVGGLKTAPSPQSLAGTAFHAAVEAHEISRIAGDEPVTHERMLAIAQAQLNEGHPYIDWDRYGISDTEMTGLAVNALEGWRNDILPTLEVYTPMMTEPYFRTDVGASAEVHGYIDWLGLDAEGRFTVVDYKTASSFSRWSGDLTGAGIEAAVYLAGAIHAETLPVDETVRMEWHVVKTKGKPEGRIIPGPEFTPDLLFFLADKLAHAEQLVAERIFPKNTGWNLCSERWCDFYHGCEVTGMLAPENLTLYSDDRDLVAADTPLSAPASPE
jgi:hypothetical protein